MSLRAPNLATIRLLVVFDRSVRARQVLIDDEFNGSAIDSSLWISVDPFSTSSITDSGGDAIFQNWEQWATQNSYAITLIITVRFTATGDSDDEFKVFRGADAS